LIDHRYRSLAPLEEEAGTLMAVDSEHVVGFYECPKLIHLPTGRTVLRWPDLSTGKQNSSIIRHIDPPPPLALDPTNRRFAVADEEKITLIQLSDLDPA
jgi:hypothetical protein